MANIAWSEKYSCGIRPIDDDHKSLFEVVDRLDKQLKDEQHPTSITATIDSLMLYAGEHFEREERFMRSAHFPGYREHKGEHDAFKNMVLGLRTLFVDEPSQIDPARVLSYLLTWLQQHILKQDMEYIPYVSGSTQGSEERLDEFHEPIEITIQCTPDKAHSIQLFAELIAGDDNEAWLLGEAAHKLSLSHQAKSLIKAKALFYKPDDSTTADIG
jgi:hemerythrin